MEELLPSNRYFNYNILSLIEYVDYVDKRSLDASLKIPLKLTGWVR